MTEKHLDKNGKFAAAISDLREAARRSHNETMRVYRLCEVGAPKIVFENEIKKYYIAKQDFDRCVQAARSFIQY